MGFQRFVAIAAMLWRSDSFFSVQKQTGRIICWSEIRVCATFFLRSGAAIHAAIQVVTTNPRYNTKQGVRVGMTYSQARRLLGRPQEYEQYSSGGVAFWSGMEVEIIKGRVRSIAVGVP